MPDLTGKKPSEFSEETALAIEQKLKSVSKIKKYIASFYCDGVDVLTVTPLNADDSDYLGNIVWSLNTGDAELYGDLANAFLENKTFFKVVPLQISQYFNNFEWASTSRVKSTINPTYVSLLEIHVYTV